MIIIGAKSFECKTCGCRDGQIKSMTLVLGGKQTGRMKFSCGNEIEIQEDGTERQVSACKRGGNAA